MVIVPIAAIGPAIVPITPVFVPSITPASSASSNLQASTVTQTTAANKISGVYYLVSGPALPQGASVSKLEDELTKAALLIGLLNSDDQKQKDKSMLDLVIAAGVLKIYEQMAAMGTTSAVGFVGDGAGGAVGISLSVTA
jgi:hypothetical protein